MSSIPTPVAAVLAKLPQLYFSQISSFEGFLKLMELKFDETTNKYKLNLSFDTNLNANEELILISEIMKRFIRYERELNSERQIREKYMRKKEELNRSYFKKFVGKLSGLEKEKHRLKKTVRQLQNKCKIEEVTKSNYKKWVGKIAGLKKENEQLKKTIRQLQSKIQQRDKFIAPNPISKETTHHLTVTKLEKEPDMYQLGRVQKRNMKRRLSQIAENEGLTFKEVSSDEKRTKIFKALPHSIDSASSLRDFLKKNNLKVEGRTQKIEWKKSREELIKLVVLFNNRGKKNVLPDAMRVLEYKLITDYFPSVDEENQHQ